MYIINVLTARYRDRLKTADRLSEFGLQRFKYQGCHSCWRLAAYCRHGSLLHVGGKSMGEVMGEMGGESSKQLALPCHTLPSSL